MDVSLLSGCKNKASTLALPRLNIQVPDTDFLKLYEQKSNAKLAFPSSDRTVGCLSFVPEQHFLGEQGPDGSGGPSVFPPAATLLIGKFTSLQGTTDSSVN